MAFLLLTAYIKYLNENLQHFFNFIIFSTSNNFIYPLLIIRYNKYLIKYYLYGGHLFKFFDSYYCIILLW